MTKSLIEKCTQVYVLDLDTLWIWNCNKPDDYDKNSFTNANYNKYICVRQ